MIAISFRRLASNPKKIALRRLVCSSNLNILMLQETLGNGDKIYNIISSMLLNCYCLLLVSDVKGRFRGLELGFN